MHISPEEAPKPLQASDFTESRRRGLAVFAARGQAYYSNRTDPETGRVYWQAFDWLMARGLISDVSGRAIESSAHATIEDAGILWSIALEIPLGDRVVAIQKRKCAEARKARNAAMIAAWCDEAWKETAS